ncbi:MAG: Exopolyphosphatase, partial [uncultured Nocardioidaceae bacterium]
CAWASWTSGPTPGICWWSTPIAVRLRYRRTRTRSRCAWPSTSTATGPWTVPAFRRWSASSSRPCRWPRTRAARTSWPSPLRRYETPGTPMTCWHGFARTPAWSCRCSAATTRRGSPSSRCGAGSAGAPVERWPSTSAAGRWRSRPASRRSRTWPRRCPLARGVSPVTHSGCRRSRASTCAACASRSDPRSPRPPVPSCGWALPTGLLPPRRPFARWHASAVLLLLRTAHWYAGCWTDERCATASPAWPVWTSTRSRRCPASRSTARIRCWRVLWWPTRCSTCSSCPRWRCARGRCARASSWSASTRC